MSIFGIGPQTGLFAFLDGSGMDPNEDQKFLQSRNPQPIDPLNENTFDPNQYGLQVTDNTFQSEPGMTLQDMLAQYENTDRVRQLSENPAINYDGLYQDPDRFLDYDNTRVDRTNQADYPFTGNIPTNRRARYDARAYNRNESLPSSYGMKGGTFFEDFDPRVGQTSQQEIYQDRIRNENLPGFSYQAEEPIGIESINIEDAPQVKEAIYQDRIMNPNLPAFASQPQYTIRGQIADDFGEIKNKIGSGLGSIRDFAIDKGRMGRNLLGSAGAMALGLPGIIGSLLSNFGDGVNYEQYTPGFDYKNLNPSMINDFYNPKTGLNRFDRARKKGNTFASSRTLAEYFEKRKVKKAAEAQAKQAAREAATAARAMARNPQVYRDAGITSGGFASQNTGTNQGFSNKSGRGRTGYSEGGLASMFTRRG